MKTSTTARAGRIATLARAVRSATRPGSPSLPDRARSLPRLVQAALNGSYPGARRTVLLMFAAAAYVVSPIDVLPEIFLGPFGLLDDGFIVAWLASTLITSTEDFMAWETKQGPAPSPSADGVQVITDLA